MIAVKEGKLQLEKWASQVEANFVRNQRSENAISCPKKSEDKYPRSSGLAWQQHQKYIKTLVKQIENLTE